MKSRIVYPTLWSNPQFQGCTKNAKLLFLYLTTNPLSGLTRYLQISDKQMQFDTDLTNDELVKSKKDLTANKLIFFYESWCYHNHDLTYIDYDGRDRVLDAKDKELSSIPQEVKHVFNQLITSYQLVLNPKSEIRKQENKGVLGEKEKVSTSDPTEQKKLSNRKPTPKDEIIALAAQMQGIRQFTNYAKQLKAIRLIEHAGHTLEDIRFVVEEMGKEQYWKENTFDLMNVYNNMDRYLNRTVIFKKEGNQWKK